MSRNGRDIKTYASCLAIVTIDPERMKVGVRHTRPKHSCRRKDGKALFNETTAT
jgi:hypothetical protein